MSDDTPTQRFDATGDAPTERFEAPAATVPLEVAEERKSRRLIIILASIGGALLLAVLIVLILLLTRENTTPGALPTSSSTPTASTTPTPSVTPSASPTPTPTATVDPPPPPPPPPSTDPAVDSFTINPTTVDCSGGGSVVITIKWSTSNANNVYFGVDTADASTGPFFGDSLPASGTSTNDFPNGYRPFDYTCGAGSHKYVITAVSADGTMKDTVSVTVTG